MGTATVTIKKRTGLAAAGACVIADITLSSSYATGGDTVPLSALGLKTCDALMLTGSNAGYTMEAVHGAAVTTDPKIKLYEDKAAAASTPLSEEANATNVSAVTVRAVIFGDGYQAA